MWCARLIWLAVAGLSACATPGGEVPPGPFAGLGVGAPAETTPRYKAEEIIGRWGIASYHQEADRARSEAAARAQCKRPYIVKKGSTGGVMMHLPDEKVAQELRIKSAADGKSYLGPAGEAGGIQDREILSFDGRVLVMRYVDPEVAARYGTMVYVRCGA